MQHPEESPPTDIVESAPESKPTRGLRGWLGFIFGFRQPVSQKTFFVVGVILIVVKYGMDALVGWGLYGSDLTLWHIFSPAFSERIQQPEPFEHSWEVTLLQVVSAFWGFLWSWAAISLSARRAVNAGGSPLIGIVVLIPVVNLVIVFLLAIAPALGLKRSQFIATEDANQISKLSAMMIGVLTGAICLTFVVTLLSYSGDALAWSVFAGYPFLSSLIAGMIVNERHPKTGYLESVFIGLVTVLFAWFGLLGFAIEGAICLAMAAPLAIPLGMLGGVVGKILVDEYRNDDSRTSFLLLLAPGLLGVDALPRPREEIVNVTSVEIAAPMEVVWDTFIEFPDIPEPRDWLFTSGIAYPIKAKIEGTGVGAIRHCIFSTGSFVEPITVWDAPRHLAFDVSEQPHPMVEMTPYRHIHPPHLDHALKSNRGEIRLTQLPNGNVLLTGTTWYELEIYPRPYWKLWTQFIIHRIHGRVLNHVKNVAEAKVSDAAR